MATTAKEQAQELIASLQNEEARHQVLTHLATPHHTPTQAATPDHTLIKLCGLRTAEEIKLCNELNVDMVGLVLFPQSKRYIEPEQAWHLKRLLKPSIKAVGVVVDEPLDKVIRYVYEGTIDHVQLHGHEDEGYIRTLRVFLPAGVRIIKAFSVSSPDDITAAANSSADAVLLDSGKGGTGEPFDWRLAASKLTRPFILAGGLTPETVATGITTCHPLGVDVSSGIEVDDVTQPGVKDLEKMRRFVAAVRATAQD